MLLSQIPVKHLLEQARSRRQDFRGLYAPLLQLINTHLPHLCLVDDWLRQEEVFTAPLSTGSPLPHVKCSPSRLREGNGHKTCERMVYLSVYFTFLQNKNHTETTSEKVNVLQINEKLLPTEKWKLSPLCF